MSALFNRWRLQWVNGWMWVAAIFAIASLAMLVPPQFRYNDKLLPNA